MQTLKIKVELNRGRHGIPLGKFAGIASDMGVFLTKLSADLELNDEKWVAANFKNSSVIFDLEKQSLDDSSFDRGKSGLRTVFLNDREHPLYHRIRPATRLYYAAIGKRIEPDDAIYIGIYRNGESEPQEGFTLTKALAAEIESQQEKRTRYHGEIQGVVHSFYKEAQPQYLKIRQLATDDLVTCYFDPSKYQTAVHTMEEESAVIFVEGEVTEDLESGQIESINISDFHYAPDFDLEFHKEFIGSKPKLTGKLAAEDFIKHLRSDAGN